MVEVIVMVVVGAVVLMEVGVVVMAVLVLTELI